MMSSFWIRPFSQGIPPYRDDLANYILDQRNQAGLSVKELAKRCGFRNLTKSIDILTRCEDEGGDLPRDYVDKIVEICGMNRERYHELVQRRIAEKEARLQLEEQNRYQRMLAYLKHLALIRSRPEFFFMKDKFVYYGQLYVSCKPLMVGELVTHWKKGIFLDRKACCGTVFQMNVVRSPMSGSERWQGFCIACGKLITCNCAGNNSRAKYSAHERFIPPFQPPEKVSTTEEFMEYVATLKNAYRG